MVTLFFSYSHVDEALRDRLEVSLWMLKRQGIISGWHDRRIVPGDDIDAAIDKRLEEANVILLLVSPDFIASDYCYSVEMTRAMERHSAGHARVIPIILRPCQWQDAPFGKLMALPKDGKPITKHADLDDAFLDIADGVRTAAASFASTTPISNTGTNESRVVAALPINSASPRSSNLRLRKTFTQADQDTFLDEAFEFMANFFEQSLVELAHRNRSLEGRFKRLDRSTFTAVAYRNGASASQCKVFVGGLLGSGISYSHDITSSNSFNERLTVVYNDQAMGLKGLGFFRGNADAEFLTAEGAAEGYWAKFMEPLQR